MKRLTEQRDSALTMSQWLGDSGSLRIYNRLTEIENILGDEYDLDKLQELVWSVRSCHTCKHGKVCSHETIDPESGCPFWDSKIKR